MVRWWVVLLFLSVFFQCGDAKKRRSRILRSDQSISDNDGVQVVDVVSGSNNFQSTKSHDNARILNEASPSKPLGSQRNVVTSSMTYSSNAPFRNTRIITINGNRMIQNVGIDDEDYYDSDNENIPIRHYATLMNSFIENVNRKYNKGVNSLNGNTNIPEYIFIHRYAGGTVSPEVIKFSPADLSQCPNVGYCLKQTRPLCLERTIYCVAPLRKTNSCAPEFRNGNLPCLNTSITNHNMEEDPIVVPCVAKLAQIDKTKRYCVTLVVVTTHIKDTMEKVHRRVQNQLTQAHKMIQNGLNAGKLGFMRGMETLKRALARIP